MNPLQYLFSLHFQFLPPDILFDHNRQYSIRKSNCSGMLRYFGADNFRPPADRSPSVKFVPETKGAEHLFDQSVQPDGLTIHYL